MYTQINNYSDYQDKLYQADYAFDHNDMRTALGYYLACQQYAERNGLPSSYIDMKICDSKSKL